MKSFISTVPGVFEAIETSDEVRSAFVFAAWRSIAGSEVADRTSPVSVEEKRLIIAVTDKTWKRNLESLASQLLFKLNASLGLDLIDFIEFRIVPELVARTRRGDDALKDGEPLVPPVELSVSARRIRDESLRKTVLQAAANCLSRQK